MSIEKMRNEDRTLVGGHVKGSDKALSGRKEEKTGEKEHLPSSVTGKKRSAVHFGNRKY